MEQTGNTTIGKRIMSLRKEAGMTQEQLAERLGISAQAVSKWENDVSCPDISMLPTLATLFNVTVDDLLGVARAQEARQEEPAAVRADSGQSWKDGSGGCEGKGWCKEEDERQDKHNWGSLGFALLLICLGVAFLVSRYSGISINIWGIVWPAVVFGLGVAWFVREIAPLGLGVAFIGFYYLLQNVGNPLPFALTWDIIWPVGLMLLGLGVLIDCFRWKSRWQERFVRHFHGRPVGMSEKDGILDLCAVFGEVNHQARCACLVGGEVRMVFSGGNLDLSRVKTLGDKGGAVLNLHIIFAGLELYVPSTMRVESRASCIFGGIDVKGGPENPTSTLTLTGEVIFGGVDIRYIG